MGGGHQIDVNDKGISVALEGLVPAFAIHEGQWIVHVFMPEVSV